MLSNYTFSIAFLIVVLSLCSYEMLIYDTFGLRDQYSLNFIIHTDDQLHHRSLCSRCDQSKPFSHTSAVLFDGFLCRVGSHPAPLVRSSRLGSPPSLRSLFPPQINSRHERKHYSTALWLYPGSSSFFPFLLIFF